MTYMLGTGNDFKNKGSAIKKYKDWIKEPGNPYTYFAITAARAMRFDRDRRTPEVHAATKWARRILLMSATDIDNGVLELINMLKNQWQFIVAIADEREPNGWASNGNVDDDKEWYDTWVSRDFDAIAVEVDKMFLGIEA